MSSMSSDGRSRKDCGLVAGFLLDLFSSRFCMRSVFLERSCRAAVVSTSGSSSSSSSSASIDTVFFFDRLLTGGASFVSWVFSSLTDWPRFGPDCVVRSDTSSRSRCPWPLRDSRLISIPGEVNDLLFSQSCSVTSSISRKVRCVHGSFGWRSPLATRSQLGFESFTRDNFTRKGLARMHLSRCSTLP
jgi:hypothetical protein